MSPDLLEDAAPGLGLRPLLSEAAAAAAAARFSASFALCINADAAPTISSFASANAVRLTGAVVVVVVVVEAAAPLLIIETDPAPCALDDPDVFVPSTLSLSVFTSTASCDVDVGA
mmetsp:Transcript_16425/g.35974  ORF Transcript_16425/g.35974 Transcript_16425/m.35974 type:complete len:116 (+) Transcript_16425:504-851(+)